MMARLRAGSSLRQAVITGLDSAGTGRKPLPL